MLLLAYFAFWACGSLGNLYVLSYRLCHYFMTCIDPVDWFHCSNLIICCWSLMRGRIDSNALLTGYWILPSFCLLLNQIRLGCVKVLLRDWSLQLRLIDDLFGTTFIPIGLFARLQLLLLLIVRPLRIQLCCILVPILMPLNSQFILEHIVHICALYSCLKFYRSAAACCLVLRASAIWSFDVELTKVLHYRNLGILFFLNEWRD